MDIAKVLGLVIVWATLFVLAAIVGVIEKRIVPTIRAIDRWRWQRDRKAVLLPIRLVRNFDRPKFRDDVAEWMQRSGVKAKISPYIEQRGFLVRFKSERNKIAFLLKYPECRRLLDEER